MLYYLFDWLDKTFDIPGTGVFQYISFRAALSVILSLVMMLALGRPFVKWLRKKQIGETVRDLDLEGQKQKSGTLAFHCKLAQVMILCRVTASLLTVPTRPHIPCELAAAPLPPLLQDTLATPTATSPQRPHVWSTFPLAFPTLPLRAGTEGRHHPSERPLTPPPPLLSSSLLGAGLSLLAHS